MEFSILNRLLDLFQGSIHDNTSRQHSHAKFSTGFDASNSSGETNGVLGSLAVPPLGNSAYVKMDDMSPVDPAYLKDMGVIKTTEITIEHSDRVLGRSVNDIDVEKYYRE